MAEEVPKEFIAMILKSLADGISGSEEGPMKMKQALTEAVKDADDKKKKLFETIVAMRVKEKPESRMAPFKDTYVLPCRF